MNKVQDIVSTTEVIGFQDEKNQQRQDQRQQQQKKEKLANNGGGGGHTGGVGTGPMGEREMISSREMIKCDF